PFGAFRPPLDHTVLKLSLELAYMTYTLDLGPWMRAGWTDISVQVDNRLESGAIAGEGENVKSERIRTRINRWKIARARMALKEHNPITLVRGAFRQREKSDTIKTVTMLHSTGGGRYVVAIGFMGTGSNFYDWFSNFRFTTQDGFHKGFLQLTESFESSTERIQFPNTAAALGLPTLTLRDILYEMGSPHSRFSLWMAGHSQGAAVMQIFCHRLLTDWGVRQQYVTGYGFASPTTAVEALGRPPADYPLIHLINSDDLVPRVGALIHLGLVLRYQADESLRKAAYGWSDAPGEVAMRAETEVLIAHVEDTPTMLVSLAALGETIIQEKTEESLNALMEKRWSIAPLDRAFTFAGGKAKASLWHFIRYTKAVYYTLTGLRMKEETLAALVEEMRPVVHAMTIRKLTEALLGRLHPPHMLYRAEYDTGAYSFIVTKGSGRLTPFVWESTGGALPRRRYAARCAVFTSRVLAVSRRAYRSGRPSPRWRGIGARRACAGRRRSRRG
ncbi:MAG: lipase family protein, partial [Eubacteriales bacterium]|nr:lipase family protein [Eubacteriales bacterium]